MARAANNNILALLAYLPPWLPARQPSAILDISPALQGPV